MWSVSRPASWFANEDPFDTRAMSNALLQTRPYYNTLPMSVSPTMFGNEGWIATNQGYLQCNHAPEYISSRHNLGTLGYVAHTLDGREHKHNDELHHYPAPHHYGAYQHANSGMWEHASSVGLGNYGRHQLQHDYALDGKAQHKRVTACTLTDMPIAVS